MSWKKYGEAEYITTRWSGGTTTQLAIAPEGAVYADRDFLWRLSSAGVEDDYSKFTALPDYERLISVLKGDLEMKIADGPREKLPCYEVRAFDGGVPVESWGQCRDFNLMLRKGKCAGAAQSVRIPAGGCMEITPPVPSGCYGSCCTAAVYCAEGEVSVSGVPDSADPGNTAEADGGKAVSGLSASAGELLLNEEYKTAPLRFESAEGAVLMVAVIFSV